MKIIHIYDGHERVFPGEGSVPTVVYKIAKYTAKKGHEVIILERRWKGLDYEEEIEGIKFKRIDVNISSNISREENPFDWVNKPLSFLKFILDRIYFAAKVSKILKKEEFDVIHVHLPFVANVLVTINKDLGKTMVYTAHIGEERKRLSLDPSAPLLLRLFSPDLYLMKRIRKTVVLNTALKEKLINKGIREEKLKVIPNGIKVDEFGSFNMNDIKKIKEKYLGKNTGKIVMFAGGITPRKGVKYLVKAARIISKKYKNVIFLLVGNFNLDRNFVEYIKNYIKTKKIENIKLGGYVPYIDLKVLYTICDIFVLPSFEEGDPIALKEALASGKPVIGSRVGGIPMQIRDGWNGFLIEPGDEKQLAEKIEYLINNEKERKKMGRNSRKIAREEFDWNKIAEKYIRLYSKIADLHK